jgi:hypothetical protein
VPLATQPLRLPARTPTSVAVVDQDEHVVALLRIDGCVREHHDLAEALPAPHPILSGHAADSGDCVGEFAGPQLVSEDLDTP